MLRLSKILESNHHKYYLTESELSEYLNISIRTLQSQRGRGDGIPYVKIGRSVPVTGQTRKPYAASSVISQRPVASNWILTGFAA